MLSLPSELGRVIGAEPGSSQSWLEPELAWARAGPEAAMGGNIGMGMQAQPSGQTAAPRQIQAETAMPLG
eukprot:2497119-Pyramimonas_sp.AAC.1